MDVLLPHLAGVAVEKVEQAGAGVQVWARVKAEDMADGAPLSMLEFAVGGLAAVRRR